MTTEEMKFIRNVMRKKCHELLAKRKVIITLLADGHAYS